MRSPILLRLALGLALAMASTLAAFGQTQKTGSTTTTTVNTPNSTLPSGFQATPQFVNGKVVMDDGTATPEGLPIERLCGGISHVEGHTDAKGGFGFELGHDDLVQDASFNGAAVVNPNRPVVSNDIAADPNRPYRECEIRANLPGYRSDSILLATYKPGENGNLGTIILHKMGNVEGIVISATAAAAPKNAAKVYEKGLDEVKKGKTLDAVQSFHRAVELYPQFAAAWLELGKLQAGMRQLVDAQQSFEAAIKAEPKLISPYIELSQLDFQSKRWPELADITEKLLKLDAFDYPREFYYNGLANYTLQRMEPAEKSLREALKLDSRNQFPKAHQFLAAILVKKNDLTGAEEELRNYLQSSPGAADADGVRRQLNGLEKVTRSAHAGK